MFIIGANGTYYMPTVRPDFMPVPQLLSCVEEWTGRSRLCHYGRYSAIAFVLSLYGRGETAPE